jgi:signal transduction histidine kinase
VLACLLDNALRYSQSGGEVSVRVNHAHPRQVEIEIADRGIGVDEDNLHLVFDRGWRSRDARENRPAGLGLGLAIASQLTQAHGGELEIRARQDTRGTLALLRLPKAMRAEDK